MICLSGTVINVYRKNGCFILWFIGEVMWLAYDLHLDFYSRSILDTAGLVLAAWGAWVNIIKPRCRVV